MRFALGRDRRVAKLAIVRLCDGEHMMNLKAYIIGAPWAGFLNSSPNRVSAQNSPTIMTYVLTPELLDKMDAYWRAANYLSVGQIYLRDNPLLKRALTLADVKPCCWDIGVRSPGRTSFTCI